jgi:hypothetical protein
MRLIKASLQFTFLGNGRRLLALTSHLNQAPWVRVGAFEHVLLLCAFIPYDKMIFSFDYNYDDNYSYNNTIVSVRGICACC